MCIVVGGGLLFFVDWIVTPTDTGHVALEGTGNDLSDNPAVPQPPFSLSLLTTQQRTCSSCEWSMPAPAWWMRHEACHTKTDCRGVETSHTSWYCDILLAFLCYRDHQAQHLLNCNRHKYGDESLSELSVGTVQYRNCEL